MLSTATRNDALNALSDIAHSLFWLAQITPEGAHLLRILAEQIEQNVLLLDDEGRE